MRKYDEEFWTPEAIAERKEERELNRWYRRKRKEQIAIGACLTVISTICFTGASVFLFPMGLWLIFSKEINIY